MQTLHGKAESALGKEQAAHRAARARMTKAEERIVLERAARQDLERRLEETERKLVDTDSKLHEAQTAMAHLAASGKVASNTHALGGTWLQQSRARIPQRQVPQKAADVNASQLHGMAQQGHCDVQEYM